MTKVYKRLAQLIDNYHNCNSKYSEIAEEKIEKLLMDFLSGSGFDSGTTLNFEESNQNKLVFESAYHHMNENGFYDEWSHFKIIVTPNLAYDFNIRLKSIGRFPRKYIETKEYILDEFAYKLDEITEI